jgi:hypothetical protein
MAEGGPAELWPADRSADSIRGAAEPQENEGTDARHRDLQRYPEEKQMVLEKLGHRLADHKTLDGLHGHERRELHRGQLERQSGRTIFDRSFAVRARPQMADQDRAQ